MPAEDHADYFEHEFHVDDDKMSFTPAQRPRLLTYPDYDQVDDNDLSDPGLVSMNVSSNKDGFHSISGDYASDPEVMFDSASSDSVQKTDIFKEVLSDIIKVRFCSVYGIN